MPGDYKHSGKRTVRTTLDDNDWIEVIEFSNRLTGGNISALVRGYVKEGLEQDQQKLKLKGKKLSPRLQAVIAERKWEERQNVLEQLRRGWLELQQDYDADFEDMLRALAEVSNTVWPPDLPVAVSAIHPQRVLGQIERMWRQNEAVTLRDLQRKMRDYGADELRRHLSYLASGNLVSLTEGNRGQMTIEPPTEIVPVVA